MKGKKDPGLKLAVFLRGLKTQGMNLSQVAARSKIPRSTLAAWSAGQTPTDLAAVKRLSKVTGFSTHFILWGSEDDVSPKMTAPTPQTIFDQWFSGRFELDVKVRKIIDQKKD